MVVEWAVINKTLEAADRARPIPVPEAPNPVTKPAVHRILAVPSPKPAVVSRPSSTVHHKKLEPSSPPLPQPEPGPARPIIKLKVGSQNNNKVAGSSSQPSTKSKKSKGTESPSSLLLNAPSGPPPPYVDDGSHDILQEVLAIEREKELRQRAHLDKERSVVNTVTGKRKKGTIVDEDEILRLATPAKKERATPPGASTSKPQAISSIPISRPSAKIKKVKPSESSRSSNNHSPAPSAKGKEKEVLISGNASDNARKVAPRVPINEKKCKDLLKNLIKLPESLIFRQAVDPLRDGCPT